MKRDFPGYYRPSAEEYKALWENAVIVLDTNVLLSAYRTPKVGRETLLNLLEGLKDRLWIPHQVGLEFQRNRLSVIMTERKGIEAALASCDGSLAAVVDKLRALDLDARGLDIDSKPLLAALEHAHAQAAEAIKKARDSQLGVTHDDPIRERIDTILDGRVGAAMSAQADLDAIYADGDKRYALFVPPGFEDSEKGKDPTEAEYVEGGLRYQRKFGDLLLWKQLLVHVKQQQYKHVILVTSDRKEDWWLERKGQTLGPHPELVSEIRREGGVDSFWMYNLPEFMKQASERLHKKVSKEGLQEIRDAVERNQVSFKYVDLPEGRARVYSFNKMLESQAEVAVLRWLAGRGFLARPNGNDYPDIIVSDPEIGKVGYEVAFLGSVRSPRFWDKLHLKLLQGRDGLNSGLYNQFNLVLVIGEDEFQSEEDREEGRRYLAKRIRNMSSITRGTRIISGFVRDGSFWPIHKSWNDPSEPDDLDDP